MRHLASPTFTSVRDCLRAILSVGALGAAFVLVVPGCQVITGTYTVGSLGPACTSLGECCVFLPSSETTTCVSVVSQENEVLCAQLRVSLPATACMAQSGDSGILFPDAQAHHDATSDAFVGHDAPQSQDVTQPGGQLEGAWKLGSITCEGNSVSMGGATTTLTFSPGDVKEVEILSDGCVETIDLGDCAISSTTITSTSGTIQCSSSCTTTDDCTAGAATPITLPYMLSNGTLSLSESNSTACASGTLEFNFQMD